MKKSGQGVIVANSGVRILRTDDELIVRSEPATSFTVGSSALLFGLFLCWAIFCSEFRGQSEVGNFVWLVTVISLFLLNILVCVLSPRSVDTTFDLQSRRIVRCTNILVWPNSIVSYSFAEILGLGIVRGSKIDERDPMPVILLKNGAILPLGVFNLNRFYVDDLGCAKILDEISAATGLQKYNKMTES